MMELPDQDILSPYLQDLEQLDLLPWCGKVTATVGLLIAIFGLSWLMYLGHG